MKILQGEAFAVLKGLYEEAFVDKACPHYINTIEKKRTFSDGAFPTGYLWDCLPMTPWQLTWWQTTHSWPV